MKLWPLALAHFSHRSVGYHEDGPGGATLFTLTAARAALLNDFGCHGQAIDIDTFGLANLHADQATATDIYIYFCDAFSALSALFRTLLYHKTTPLINSTLTRPGFA